jgi:hypothetical protein
MKSPTHWLPRKELKKLYPWVSDWRLAKLRKARAVAFLKIGHRTIVYDPEKFDSALRRLETREIA